MSDKPRFIRVGGRIIPIRNKKNGEVDKRHISDKKLAHAAAKMKPDVKGAIKGAAAGGLIGAAATFKKVDTITSKLHLVKGNLYRFGTPTVKSVASINKRTAALGAIAGLALGSLRFTTKKAEAEKLKKLKNYRKL